MAQQSMALPPSIVSVPIPGAIPVRNIFCIEFTTNFGSIAALTGTAKTFNIPGLQVNDWVSVKCTGSLTTGATIANARVSAPDTLEINFTTAVALGVTLGSLTYRVFVLRP